MIFNYDEELGKRRFIDKNDILKHITEEQIFELVFGYQPKEYDYVVSPFREDTNPGCWFSYAPSGKLKFVDFGSQIFIRGIKMINIDCFDAVQVYYKLPNLYKTLEFVQNKLIKGKNIDTTKIAKVRKKRRKKKVSIDIEPRIFDARDKQFWEKYGITKQNLIDDKVFPVKKFSMKNTKKGDITVRCYDVCYAYTRFVDIYGNIVEGKKKLYRPYQKGKYRFITNCSQNEVGGLEHLPQYGKKLVITKSYKDYRVLKNQSLNVVWFQNEGMTPSKQILVELCKRFTYITVFFDNDNTGIKEGKRISEIINSYFPGKAGQIYLSPTLTYKSVTDPSDFYAKYGKELLNEFLKQKKLL